MPHIHDKPGQHDLTASAFIFRTDGPQPRVILHNHRVLHKYLQFGGHVELHENPWAALLHEVREESGYDIGQLKLFQPPHICLTDFGAAAKAHPQPFSFLTFQFGDQDHFHTDAAYAFATDLQPRHKINDGESTELHLFTRREVAELPGDAIPENVRIETLFVFDNLINKWELVDPANYPA